MTSETCCAARPLDGRDQGPARRRERAIEDLYRHQVRVGRLLVNRRGHRGAVAEPIDGIAVIARRHRRRPPGDDTPHVRMSRVNAAVHDGDADAAARPSGERRQRQGDGSPHDEATLPALPRRTAAGSARRRARQTRRRRRFELGGRARRSTTARRRARRRVGGRARVQPVRDHDRRPAAHDARDSRR